MLRAIKLKEGEEVILVVKQSPISYSMPILAGLLLFLLPFFFLFPLFSWGKWGIAGFIAMLVFALGYSAYHFIMWTSNCGVITNQRVVDIDQRGLFDRVVSEVPYYKIDDVSYNIKGPKQTMFRYGNVVVAIRGYRSSVTLKNISRPALVQELILEIERKVRGWDKEGVAPMDNIMSEMDKLSDVEKKALQVALKKINK